MQNPLRKLQEEGSLTHEELRSMEGYGTEITSDGAFIAVDGHPGDQWTIRANSSREMIVDAWEEAEVIENHNKSDDCIVKRFERDDAPDLLLIATTNTGRVEVNTVVYANSANIKDE